MTTNWFVQIDRSMQFYAFKSHFFGICAWRKLKDDRCHSTRKQLRPSNLQQSSARFANCRCNSIMILFRQLSEFASMQQCARRQCVYKSPQMHLMPPHNRWRSKKYSGRYLSQLPVQSLLSVARTTECLNDADYVVILLSHDSIIEVSEP
jgi:hypothetical protein